MLHPVNLPLFECFWHNLGGGGGAGGGVLSLFIPYAVNERAAPLIC